MANTSNRRFPGTPSRGTVGSLLSGARALQLLILLLVALLGAIFPARGVLARNPSGTWSDLGSLAEPRAHAAALLLPDGRVLIAGGEGAGGPLSTSEVLTQEGIMETAAPMRFARSGHQAVLLATGKVLVLGGIGSDGATLESAEIYDPVDDSWSPAGSMSTPRSGFTASLLGDGRVLIVGGTNGSSTLTSVELFDPSNETFSMSASVLSSPRSAHTATVMGDGRVLLAGGSDGSAPLSSTDLYSPASDSMAPGPRLDTGRAEHSATRLLDGSVLIAGGTDGATELTTAEVVDAFAASIAAVPGGLAAARRGHWALYLPHNGSVLIGGGNLAGSDLASCELYLPARGEFVPTSSQGFARSGGFALALAQEGIAMAAGGDGAATAGTYGFATLKTDKDDYAPEQAVTISGSGWEAGEQVNFLLKEDPETHEDLEWSTTADENGSILDTSFAPEWHDQGVRFYLTATGSISVAQATFTDGTPTRITTSSMSPNSGGCRSTITASAMLEFKTGPANAPFDGLAGKTVSFTLGSSSASGVTGANGIATANLTVPPGATSLVATFAGDSTYNGTSSSLSFAVTGSCDSTPPVITPSVAGALGTNGWFVSNVGIGWTVTDPDSSVTSTSGCATGSVSSDTAGVTFTCTATSSGGTSSSTVTIKRDATPPTATLFVSSGTPGANGWYVSDVTVSTSGADPMSGPVTCTPAQSLSTSTAGTSVNGSCTNGAGLSSNASPMIIKLDKTGPTAGLAVSSGTPGSNGWYVSDVTVATSGNDAISGPVTCSPDQQQTDETTGATFAGSCTNAAGLSTDAATLVVKVDKTGPSAGLAVSSGTPGSNGWYVSDVTVATSGNDSISGPVSCTGNQIISADTPGTAVQGACSNRAGLTTNAAPLTIKLDKTAPILSITSPNAGAYTLNATVTSAYSCSDGTSGINTCSGLLPSGSSLNTSTVGSKIFSVTGTDLAGNQATLSRTYNVQYAASGACLNSTGHSILQPINPEGNSVFKQKSTVPAKFRVCDAKGQSIGTPDVVSSFRLVQKSSGTLTDVDEAVNSTTPDTAFRWDPIEQQWIFNMATKSLLANSSYYYRVTLNDSTTIDFFFGLK